MIVLSVFSVVVRVGRMWRGISWELIPVLRLKEGEGLKGLLGRTGREEARALRSGLAKCTFGNEFNHPQC